VQIATLMEERDALRSAASDCSRLQTDVADLQAKLEDTQHKLEEHASVVGVIVRVRPFLPCMF